MSGDVQPRKRKDKKRKKDELGIEEPRGTAAALGEGDVFMHSQHEHGTGGHWCAKIIFFSLLAVLVTLIGLIILENRGLTELEANSVESRYSGVLDGWLEDAPDDDHHDEHTLELLKQHDDDDDDHDEEHDVSQEDDHDPHVDDEDEAHDDADNNDDEDEQEVSNEDDEQDQQDDDDDQHDDDDDQDQQDDDNSEEQQLDNADEDDNDDNEHTYESNESAEDNDDDDDDLQRVDENDTAEDDDDNIQNDQADYHSDENDENENSHENDEEHEETEEEEGDSEIEVEKLEKEVTDEDALSEEQPTQESEEEDDKSQEVSTEVPLEDDVDAADEADSVEDEEFLEADDIDEPLPVVERIVAPKGKPLAEVEDEPTTEKPVDTLVEEEEYEKQQEELRREEAQASHVWLKLAVGGALLVATHAVVSRAVAPRDDTPASEDHASREDTPSTIDRRMTLIPQETVAAAPPKEVVEEVVRPIVEEKVFETVSPIIKSAPQPTKEEIEEEEEEEEEEEDVKIDTKDVTAAQPAVELETEDKELYSDEEEEVEEEEEGKLVQEKKEAPKQATPVSAKVIEPETEEAEEDVPDDVEIIDDEQLEEELEEEDDEEEISDVDDAELLSRLEAKYGRLPEPDRPGQKHKDGGNSIEADWPGEPSDKYWRQQLDEAEQELRQGEWSAASERVSAHQLKGSVRARWILARAIDASAEANRDNRLLTRAITAYLDVLKLNEHLSDDRLREIAGRTLDRIRFRGNYLSAEPVYRLLTRRFPDVVDYRNNMTVSLLMANRADLAEEVIKETLRKWPDDRIALAHLGFILKTQHNRLEEAVEAFQKALEGDIGPATEPRFYYHLGDALLLLGRFTEAHEVHKRGAKLGHFLSPSQRSLYNVERLKSRPWWDIEQTPYLKLARALEKSWKEILKEGQAAQALYEKEKEGLKERGEWSQLDLFVRGQEVPGRCKEAPVTCSIVRAEAAAAGCRRGQIKFSSMEAGTHVRPHVGPTNCRLRMHLGLSNTKDTYIRVDQETRQWQVGKVLMFDDSFEHEVWHNGTGARLVLIVDVWHPALSHSERRSLPPI